jgi:hypothetical protein
MMAQYFFMFSSGAYSDYGVHGLHVCDHPVSKQEWYDYYKVYQEEVARLRSVVEEKFGTRWYWSDDEMVYSSSEYVAYDNYQREGCEGAFQRLHNMKELQVEEFWRDC